MVTENNVPQQTLMTLLETRNYLHQTYGLSLCHVDFKRLINSGAFGFIRENGQAKVSKEDIDRFFIQVLTTIEVMRNEKLKGTS